MNEREFLVEMKRALTIALKAIERRLDTLKEERPKAA